MQLQENIEVVEYDCCQLFSKACIKVNDTFKSEDTPSYHVSDTTMIMEANEAMLEASLYEPDYNYVVNFEYEVYS